MAVTRSERQLLVSLHLEERKKKKKSERLTDQKENSSFCAVNDKVYHWYRAWHAILREGAVRSSAFFFKTTNYPFPLEVYLPSWFIYIACSRELQTDTILALIKLRCSFNYSGLRFSIFCVPSHSTGCFVWFRISWLMRQISPNTISRANFCHSSFLLNIFYFFLTLWESWKRRKKYMYLLKLMKIRQFR